MCSEGAGSSRFVYANNRARAWDDTGEHVRFTGQAVWCPKSLVWEAYKRVRANKGAAGVDRCSMEEFEKDPKKNDLSW
jgi:hypothetical protein